MRVARFAPARAERPRLQQALQQHPTSLPIVFVTGRGDITSSVQAMKAGAVDFLTKPVEPQTLLKAIDTALARDRAARASREHTSVIEARYGRRFSEQSSVRE